MILVRHALGEVLRRHRTDQNRTLRDVADAARVSLGYLSEIERGQKEPSSELLYAVCDALGVPLSELLAETGEHVRAKETASSRPDSARPPRAGVAPGRARRVVLGRTVTVPGEIRGRAPMPRVVLGHPAGRPTTMPVTDLVSLPVAIPDPVLVTDLGDAPHRDIDPIARELAHAAA